MDFVDDGFEPALLVVAKPHAQGIENIAQDARIAQNAARSSCRNVLLRQQIVQPGVQWPSVAMILVVKTEHGSAIVSKQLEASVQRREFIELQQHGKDTIVEAMPPGPEPLVRHQ